MNALVKCPSCFRRVKGGSQGGSQGCWHTQKAAMTVFTCSVCWGHLEARWRLRCSIWFYLVKRMTWAFLRSADPWSDQSWLIVFGFNSKDQVGPCEFLTHCWTFLMQVLRQNEAPSEMLQRSDWRLNYWEQNLLRNTERILEPWHGTRSSATCYYNAHARNTYVPWEPEETDRTGLQNQSAVYVQGITV